PLDRRSGDCAVSFGAVEGFLDPVSGRDRPEVDQRPRPGRHRYKTDMGAISIREVARVVNDDVLPTMSDMHRHEHLDDIRCEAIEPVKCCGRSMRRDALGSAVEACCEHVVVPRPRARREPEHPGRNSLDDTLLYQTTEPVACELQGVRIRTGEQTELLRG